MLRVLEKKKVKMKLSAADQGSANVLTLQKELIKCGEVLFQPKVILQDHDDSIVSIPQMVAEVVNKCDLDTRRELLGHIFLSGGVTTMDGFTNDLLMNYVR